MRTIGMETPMKKTFIILITTLILIVGFAVPSYALSEEQSVAIQTLLDDACRICYGKPWKQGGKALENKRLLSISIIILAMSIVFGSLWIGYSLEKSTNSQTPISSSDLTGYNVLNSHQVAQYLNLTEEEVKGIIQTEMKILDETGSFYGKMFPYLTINNKQYFYKDEIDEWLREVSSQRSEYNTIEGWVLQ